jgi:rod shape determining protein RodA
MIATTGISRMRRRDMTAAWRHVDVVLCVLIACATLMGALMIYSATKHKAQPYAFIEKHAVFVVIGFAAMAIAAAIDYERIVDFAWLFYAGSIGLLLAVLVLGSTHNGSKAWFDFGPLSLQPAELAKLAMILAIAAYLGRLEGPVSLRHVVVALVIMGIPMGLILLQPDLGTTLVFVGVGVGLLMVANVPTRYLVALVLVGVVGVVGILNSNTLDRYQRDRLTSFVNPNGSTSAATYNTKAAQEAIASGGITGQGLFEGPQTKGGFVPEQQTDFIFTVPAEELGFAGAGLAVLLLGGIAWRVFRTAKVARDSTGRLICVGVLCMLMFHIFENVGMNLGIMPVTGIPLPFFSYGGSSTITTFIALGLVLNVHMRRYT